MGVGCVVSGGEKYEETRTIRDVCAALPISCHFDQVRRGWMDGGARQEEMDMWLK